MKKKLLPLVIAAVMAPGFAAAADVSGYVDVMYNLKSDSAPTTDGSFGAGGEVNVSASPADGVTVRMDVDLMLDPAGAGNSAVLEQAFFAWGAAEGITVIGGVFNNPIGKEGQDAPDMWGTNGGVVGNALNSQTALYSNNIAGLAVAGAVGPATITAALLNDITGTPEEYSMAVVANISPMDGLDLEVGIVTADASTEGGTDVNFTYAIPGVDGLAVGADVLIGNEVVDTALEATVDYSMGAVGVGARIEDVSYAVGDSNSRTTIHASYAAASNLTAVLELADGTVDNAAMSAVDGIAADSTITLELIATF